MKLQYFKGPHPNFGDELNAWMWPRLMPDFFDEDTRTLFIGIGSTIGDHYDTAATKIIFGTGYVPHYCGLPNVHGGDWDIYFVRGPRTAKLLKISPTLSLGDSAILLRTLVDYRQRSPEVVSFIPHWESLGSGHWQEVCRLAGINLIDPRRPVEEVIKEMLRSKLIVAEAMHGAIVADALRVPWIPVLPINVKHRAKWFDWAEALEIVLDPYRLWPSSLPETRDAFVNHPRLIRLTNLIVTSPACNLSEKAIIHLAAHRLNKIANATPVLSEEHILSSVTNRMCDCVYDVTKKYAK